ncbi:MAG TPA: hypothetical protein VJ912_01780 [Candidatus Nanoarchaeia archaeon]|nr:hypothetical protein [Candidatus Nanoarchaeia archaeon]
MKNSKELREFGRRFLLMFTAELIRNRGGAEIYRLKKILEKESVAQEKIKEYKNKKELRKKETSAEDFWNKKEKEQDLKKLLKERKKENSPEEIKKRLRRTKRSVSRKPVLKVPQTRLPKQFKNIRPQIEKRDIDLGKLEKLINDPNVREIECKGPWENIYVRGNMGYQPTKIYLSDEEISELLNKFSNKSQIPLMQGNYHVAIGDLTITASIEEERGESKFVIKKMPKKQPPPQKGRISGRRPPMPKPMTNNQQRKGVPAPPKPPQS